MGRPRANRVCDVPGCGKPHKGNGLCQSHYMKEKRGTWVRGLLLPPPDDPPRPTRGPESRHIIQQIRAALDFEGGLVAMFQDGTRLRITRRLANAVLAFNESIRKPEDKAAFQAALWASRASFVEALNRTGG